MYQHGHVTVSMTWILRPLVHLSACSRAPLPSTTMDPATSRILQLHLETTLRLLVSLSPLMLPNDIMMARIHLTESNIILGRLLAERDPVPVNGKLNHPQPSPFIQHLAIILNAYCLQQPLKVPVPELITPGTPAPSKTPLQAGLSPFAPRSPGVPSAARGKLAAL